MKSIKIIAVLLALILSFSLTACSDREEKGKTIQRTVYEGTHDYTAPERDNAYMFRNGTTDYTLIVPAEHSDYIKMARREFTYLLAQAMGISIAVQSDTGLEHTADAKYISLGETTLLASSGIEVDKETLGTDGHRIVTKDQSVYLFGGSDEGTLFAVYTFMQINFNFDCYNADFIEIDKGVRELKLKDYQVTDIPDIPVRFQDGGALYNLDTNYDEYFPARMRELHSNWDSAYQLNIYPQLGVYENAVNNTNTEEIFPRDTLYAEHSEWYSNNGQQLCYTARGDEAEFEQMTEYAAAKIIDAFIAQPREETDPPETAITISCEDNMAGCTCDACAALSSRYGTDSGALIIFFNEVGRLVDEWMKGTTLSSIFDSNSDISEMILSTPTIQNADADRSPYVREDYHIIFFAYYMYTYAPCTYDENGAATPIDEDVIMRDNVGVWLANIYTDYTQSIYAEANLKEKNNIAGWAACGDFVWNYSYWINFRAYNYFYDFFSYFSEDAYAIMAANDTKTYYHQGSNIMGVASCFRTLGTYLNSKLAWDSSLKATDLIDKYFNGVYREAAPIMKQLFMEERAYYVNLNTEYGFYGSYSVGNDRFTEKKYFPLQTMYAFMDRCDEAIAAIEKYRSSDSALYTALCNHINMERISPMYWTLYFHSDTISYAEKQRLLGICSTMDETLNLALNFDREGSTQSFRDFYQSYM